MLGFTHWYCLLKSTLLTGSFFCLKMLPRHTFLQANPMIVVIESLFFLSFFFCIVDFFFSSAIAILHAKRSLLKYKINMKNFIFGFFLNVCINKLPVNGNCFKFGLSRALLNQIECNLFLTKIYYSIRWTKNLKLVFDLAFIFDFKPSNCLINSTECIVSVFWLKILLRPGNLPAEPIRVIRQILFLYSGLNSSFAGAILVARKCLQLLNCTISKINFVFGFFLNICNKKSQMNEIYYQIWFLHISRKTLHQI